MPMRNQSSQSLLFQELTDRAVPKRLGRGWLFSQSSSGRESLYSKNAPKRARAARPNAKNVRLSVPSFAYLLPLVVLVVSQTIFEV